MKRAIDTARAHATRWRLSHCVAWLTLLGCGVSGTSAYAQTVATVTNLSGVLTAKHIDGSTTMLGARSSISQGDTLVSESNTYAQLRFIDDSDMVVRPSSRLVIESYAYDVDHPERDKVAIRLMAGGLRSVTGLLGKRNHDAIRFETPAGNIAVRGTTFIAQLSPVPPKATITPTPAATPAALPSGLYVQVLDGAIAVTNQGGAQNFTAGQFGFTPSVVSAPVVVPVNPGLQFTPPPAFSSSAAPSTVPKSAAVDCIVR